MFSVGNIVRRVDHPDDILTVINIDSDSTGILDVRTENAHGDKNWCNAQDLELVTEQLEELEQVAKPDLVMSRTIEQLYEDINILFTQVIQYYQMQDMGKTLELTIHSNTSSHADGVTIECKARLSYGQEVTTRTLHDSTRIVCEREKEDKLLAPLEIAFK